MDLLTLAVLALAAARITRAVVDDDVGAPVRDLIVRTFERFGYAVADRRYPVGAEPQPEAARFHDLVVRRWASHGVTLASCPWCLGFWVSLGTIAFYAWVPAPWNVALLAVWAVSYLVGWITQVTDLLQALTDAADRED